MTGCESFLSIRATIRTSYCSLALGHRFRSQGSQVPAISRALRSPDTSSSLSLSLFNLSSQNRARAGCFLSFFPFFLFRNQIAPASRWRILQFFFFYFPSGRVRECDETLSDCRLHARLRSPPGVHLNFFPTCSGWLTVHV